MASVHQTPCIGAPLEVYERIVPVINGDYEYSIPEIGMEGSGNQGRYAKRQEWGELRVHGLLGSHRSANLRTMAIQGLDSPDGRAFQRLNSTVQDHRLSWTVTGNSRRLLLTWVRPIYSGESLTPKALPISGFMFEALNQPDRIDHTLDSSLLEWKEEPLAHLLIRLRLPGTLLLLLGIWIALRPQASWIRAIGMSFATVLLLSATTARLELKGLEEVILTPVMEEAGIWRQTQGVLGLTDATAFPHRVSQVLGQGLEKAIDPRAMRTCRWVAFHMEPLLEVTPAGRSLLEKLRDS